MLTETHLATWAAQGWLHLPSALSAGAVAELDQWVREVEGWSSADGPGMHHFEQTEHGPAIARSEDFDPNHRGLSSFLRTGILADVLARLFGEPAVLFKEKINYKHPGGAGFAPHQDATAYRFVDHHISVMVPLDPATVESGCLYFAPIEPAAIANTDGRMDPAWVDAATWTAAPVEPGDLVFFDSYTPHYSGPNTSDRSRRVMYLTYNAASHGDFRQQYYDDKKALLADAGDGDRVRISVNDDFLGIPVSP